ncbi:LamG-like jellyroll fold domain-containing protein [Plantactinospora sp. B24E8]|uniref:LamG-like jellyroll fold domain-containing protein n=1 Tax=Plantactinospora sp. B24E8 TaxID=3153567 RepID=UPI00325D2ACB
MRTRLWHGSRGSGPSGCGFGRRIATGSVLALLAGSLSVAAPATAAPVPLAAELDEAAARAAAVSSGRPVEVTAMSDERQRVVANPDGSFTLTQTVVPTRVRRGDGWVPVDTTLRFSADGQVAPVATPLEMTFSGGGTAPMARLRRDGTELALSWPTPLPRPVLSGDTATYPEVLPGVDLTVRALVEGFSELLVVRSAQAAANPALARLRLLTSTAGLSVRTTADGSLAALDAAGRAVFEAPAPYMWDSSGSGRRTVPGGQVRSVRAAVSTGEVALVPDRGLLTGRNTKYPVYIDPSWTGSRTAWTQVWSNYPTLSFWNGANDAEDEARVGYDATDRKTTRSFFKFNVSGVKNKHILGATLQTHEVWSRSCTAREVQVWETGGISSSTTWKNQPSWITKLAAKSVAKGYSSSCPAGGIEFNVTAHVVKAAAAGRDTLDQGLKASATAESNKDTLSWKRFRNNPSISITYNTVPGVPTSLTTDGASVCKTGTGRLVIGTTTPTLRATVSDTDNSVKARFQWWTLDGTAPVGEFLSASVAGKTPTIVAKQIPSGAFANGATGRWRVRGEDGTDNSAWSAWCEFQVDTSRPPIPTVTSTAFPDGAEGTAVMGRSVPVGFGPNGGTDVASYEYVLNGDSTVLSGRVTPAADGTATVSVTPDRFVNWLHVRSVDRAANRSTVATVVFYAGPPSGPVADWTMDESGDGTTAVDSTANGWHAALVGGAAWADGVTGGALDLDGVSGHAVTSGPVVDTMRSFSVSTWARIDDLSHNQVLFTQPGTRASAFALYYSSAYSRWIFNRTTADVDKPTFVRATSTSAPAAGTWTHLAGVYDAPAQRIRLYVNGVLAAETAFTSPWSATGPFQIGRAQVAGVWGEYWTGGIDGVRVHDRVLLPGELQQVPRLAGHWKLDETSGTTAADPAGGHPATWSSTGVTRTTGVSGNAVVVDGTTGVLTASGPAVRTDASYTVTAWARPDTLTKNGIAVSQLGAAVAGFNLGYSWNDDHAAYLWSVRSSTTDAAGAELRQAENLFDAPVAGTWTHLAAVYDAQAHRLRLYVNGQLADETHHAGSWHANGALLIGRGQVSNVSFSQYFTGGVDDVRAYAGVLSDQEIFDLHNAVANPN